MKKLIISIVLMLSLVGCTHNPKSGECYGSTDPANKGLYMKILMTGQTPSGDQASLVQIIENGKTVQVTLVSGTPREGIYLADPKNCEVSQ